MGKLISAIWSSWQRGTPTRRPYQVRGVRRPLLQSPAQDADGRLQCNCTGLTHALGFAPRRPIPVGTIPADIGKLTKLLHLNLYEIQGLSGECANGPISAS